MVVFIYDESWWFFWNSFSFTIEEKNRKSMKTILDFIIHKGPAWRPVTFKGKPSLNVIVEEKISAVQVLF